MVGSSGGFRPATQEDLAPSGAVARARANLAALELLRQLQADNRRPTAVEQRVLARWSGWGAVPGVFETDPDRPDHARFADVRARVRELLSDEEFDAAADTTLNAHYTDIVIAKAMWDTLGDLGFEGGKVLEPGCGAGTFMGTAPTEAVLTGVEVDPTTAAIAAALYPQATIRAESFADTDLPEGTFDAAVGNVPFAQLRLVDRRHNPNKRSIHDHFVLKALHLVRPGGLVAVLTSRYTLDARDPGARREIAEVADLVGAVRLPSSSHQRAAGTKVVMDLLMLHRREPGQPAGRTAGWRAGQPAAGEGFEQVRTVEVEAGTAEINEYFMAHPELVLGTLATGSGHGMYRRDDLAVLGDGPLEPAIREALAAVVRAASGDRPQPAEEAPEGLSRPVARVEGNHEAQEGYLAQLPGGAFTQVVRGKPVAFEVVVRERVELAALLGLRDTVVGLLDAEAASVDDPDGRIAALRAQLNRSYDTYVKAWGPINRCTWRRTGRTDPDTGAEARARIRPKQGGFGQDPFAPAVYALEIYDATSQTAARADIFHRRVVGPRPRQMGADTAADALAICWDEHAQVRLEVIARLLGTDVEDARRQLGTLVFDDPVDGRLVPAAEYLSGDVRAKLAQARDAARRDSRFAVNVEALEPVIPVDLQPDEIRARLGAAWIDAGTVREFLTEILRDATVQVEHASDSMVWAVRGDRDSVLATSVWGTDRYPATTLVQTLLEQRRVTVMDEDDDRRVLNPEATAAAQAKAAEIHARFAAWMWEAPARRERMARRYNSLFNGLVLRSYDNVSLTLPGVALTFTPRPHQVAAVARMIAEPAVLLAHDVGAGKTAEMVMGCMELRRLGLATIPAVIVPNHMLEQFRNDWLRIYPQARLLAAGSADLAGDGRRRFVASCATGDWDAVIMTRGAFERIPVAPEARTRYLRGEVDGLQRQLDEMRREGTKLTVKRLRAALKRAEEKLKRKLTGAKDAGVSFEQCGIDYLCIDEAHAYKNLATLSNIPDAAIDGSARASDLDMKLHYLRSRGRDRVVTFATATPLANSITEAHVMQRYLRPDLLEAAGLTAFDTWAATFGETVSAFELTPDGSGFRLKTRFAKFSNVPELLRMWHVPTDVKTAADLKLPVPALAARADGQRAPEIVVNEPSDELQELVAELAGRADLIRQRRPELIPNRRTGVLTEDNMLWVTFHGRSAALDLRLVDRPPGNRPSKVDTAADKITDMWRAHCDNEYVAADGSAHPVRGALQIVFCDLGTPSDRWNVYDELRDQLIARGMPADKIRYVHQARNDREKGELFAACNNGEVAVLIGSTERMGVGTNIQTRAVALHHLDVPWRPADLQQREGRILRRGNQNPEVWIGRYVTEGSFDAFMWGAVTRKASFIAQIMRGSLDVREIDDIGDAALSYDEVKALATGNPAILEKANADSELTRLERLARTHDRDQLALDARISTGERRLRRLTEQLERMQAALPRRKPTRGDAFAMQVSGIGYTRRVDAGTALIAVLDRALQRAAASEQTRLDHGIIGTLGGLDVHASTDRFVRMEVLITLDELPITETRLTLKALRDADPVGLITRLEHGVDGLDHDCDETREAIAVEQAQIGDAREQLGKPFPQAAELNAARDRVEALTAQLHKDSTNSNDTGPTPDSGSASGTGSGSSEQTFPTPPSHDDDDDEREWLASAVAHDAMAMAQMLGGVTAVAIQPGGQALVVHNPAGPSRPDAGPDAGPVAGPAVGSVGSRVTDRSTQPVPGRSTSTGSATGVELYGGNTPDDVPAAQPTPAQPTPAQQDGAGTGAETGAGSGTGPDAPATLYLLHTSGGGTLLTGTERGDGNSELLKTVRERGWRWMWSNNIVRDGRRGAWYVPSSRGTIPNHAMITRTVEVLRRHGRDVRFAGDLALDTAQDTALTSSPAPDRPVAGAPAVAASSDRAQDEIPGQLGRPQSPMPSASAAQAVQVPPISAPAASPSTSAPALDGQESTSGSLDTGPGAQSRGPDEVPVDKPDASPNDPDVDDVAPGTAASNAPVLEAPASILRRYRRKPFPHLATSPTERQRATDELRTVVREGTARERSAALTLLDALRGDPVELTKLQRQAVDVAAWRATSAEQRHRIYTRLDTHEFVLLHPLHQQAIRADLTDMAAGTAHDLDGQVSSSTHSWESREAARKQLQRLAPEHLPPPGETAGLHAYASRLDPAVHRALTNTIEAARTLAAQHNYLAALARETRPNDKIWIPDRTSPRGYREHIVAQVRGSGTVVLDGGHTLHTDRPIVRCTRLPRLPPEDHTATDSGWAAHRATHASAASHTSSAGKADLPDRPGAGAAVSDGVRSRVSDASRTRWDVPEETAKDYRGGPAPNGPAPHHTM